MPSAGTRLPAERTTTSPGTTSSTGTLRVCALRTTVARVWTSAWSLATALWALYSRDAVMPTLAATMISTIPASIH